MVAGLAIDGRWRSALFFLTITLVGPGLFAQVMKNLVHRPRPTADEALGLGIIWQRTLINAHWFSDTIFGLVAPYGSCTSGGGTSPLKPERRSLPI